MKFILANIIPKSNNITRHLTETRKIMSFSSIIITSAFVIVSLSFTNIIPTANTHAESFQSSEQLQFTLNPTISINISSNLTIESLVPGDAKDSNIITVIASSNASAGYNLTSTVGTTNNASNELRKDGANTTNKFTNLTSNQSTLAGFNDNEWGYSYSICSTPECTNEPTWISGNTGSTLAGYDGYDYNTTTSTSETITHLTTTTSGSSAIKYKIGAKSSATQLAGEYTNAINFIGIAKPNPAPPSKTFDEAFADAGKTKVDGYYVMQDMNKLICAEVAVGQTTTLMDIRDHQTYNIVRFDDLKCWMTTNLDLAGGTALSSTDTDFDSSYELPTTNGWTVQDNKLIMPASSTTGFDTDNYAYVYNSGRTPASDSGCTTPGCYSYYSWDTATVGSGRSITTSNTDAPYSICPKGWRLPNTRIGTNDTADFRKLMTALGGSADIQSYDASTSPTGATMFGYLSNEPLNYLRAGRYDGSTFYSGGSGGHYWSATSNSETYARNLTFYSTLVFSADNFGRRLGFSVRCIADQ